MYTRHSPGSNRRGDERALPALRHGTELCQQTHGIFFAPVLDDFSICDPNNVNARKFNTLPGRGDALEVACVRASHGDARHNLIALCDQLIDLRMPVGHG